MPHINTNEFDWKSLARAVFVPENKKARQFIKGFSGMKSHLAVLLMNMEELQDWSLLKM
jgi:Mg2+/Co2+ transporter CorC